MIKKFLKLTMLVPCIGIVAFAGGCTYKSSYEWAVSVARAHYFEELPSELDCGGSAEQFVATYLDKYSAFYTKEKYNSVMSSNAGNKSGFGISTMYIAEGVHPEGSSGILIERVAGNSPAYFAGFEVGEFILGAKDGQRDYKFTTPAEYNTFIDGVAAREEVVFECDRHEGGHKVAKAEYVASYCKMATATATYTISYAGGTSSLNQKERGISCLPEGVAYVKIDQFYGKASNELATLIAKYNALECSSLILDLRGNGGGYVDCMQEISGIFLGNLEKYCPVAMNARDRKGATEEFRVIDRFSSDSKVKAGTKVSILADNGTASASEALIGVLIDNGVASFSDVYISDLPQAYLTYTNTTEKNAKTYGKGIMQTTYKNSRTGEGLKLTTAKIFWPKNEISIHDKGLSESMGCKPLKAVWNVTYEDSQLALAVSEIYG